MGIYNGAGLDEAFSCPKRKFRWLFSIPGIISSDGNDATLLALPHRKGARPSLSFTEEEAQHVSEKVYFPMKPDWKPIQLSLYDINRNQDRNPIFDWFAYSSRAADNANLIRANTGNTSKTKQIKRINSKGKNIGGLFSKFKNDNFKSGVRVDPGKRTVGLYNPKEGTFGPNSSEEGIKPNSIDTTNGTIVGIKKTAILELYDGCGCALERWVIEGCYPQDINFGDLDMDLSEVVMIDVTIRYDRAYLEDEFSRGQLFGGANAGVLGGSGFGRGNRNFNPGNSSTGGSSVGLSGSIGSPGARGQNFRTVNNGGFSIGNTGSGTSGSQYKFGNTRSSGGFGGTGGGFSAPGGGRGDPGGGGFSQ